MELGRCSAALSQCRGADDEEQIREVAYSSSDTESEVSEETKELPYSGPVALSSSDTESVSEETMDRQEEILKHVLKREQARQRAPWTSTSAAAEPPVRPGVAVIPYHSVDGEDLCKNFVSNRIQNNKDKELWTRTRTWGGLWTIGSSEALIARMSEEEPPVKKLRTQMMQAIESDIGEALSDLNQLNRKYYDEGKVIGGVTSKVTPTGTTLSSGASSQQEGKDAVRCLMKGVPMKDARQTKPEAATMENIGAFGKLESAIPIKIGAFGKTEYANETTPEMDVGTFDEKSEEENAKAVEEENASTVSPTIGEIDRGPRIVKAQAECLTAKAQAECINWSRHSKEQLILDMEVHGKKMRLDMEVHDEKMRLIESPKRCLLTKEQREVENEVNEKELKSRVAHCKKVLSKVDKPLKDLSAAAYRRLPAWMHEQIESVSGKLHDWVRKASKASLDTSEPIPDLKDRGARRKPQPIY